MTNPARMNVNTESNLKKKTLWKWSYFKRPVPTYAPLTCISINNNLYSPMLPLHSSHTRQSCFHFRDKGLWFYVKRNRNWCEKIQYIFSFHLCKSNWREGGESTGKFTYTWGFYISINKSENTSSIKRQLGLFFPPTLVLPQSFLSQRASQPWAALVQ